MAWILAVASFGSVSVPAGLPVNRSNQAAKGALNKKHACIYIYNTYTLVWRKTKQEGLRRCGSMFSLTRAPFWYQFFEPQPLIYFYTGSHQPVL